MPRQETFLKKSAGPITVEVIKTYDGGYAREVFESMEQDAKEALAQTLELDQKYDPEDIPNADEIQYDDFLWEQLTEQSLEDVRQLPRQHSFFVVCIGRNGEPRNCYVFADWPSAERYAKSALRIGV